MESETIEDVTQAVVILQGDHNIADPVLCRRIVQQQIQKILAELVKPPREG